MTEQTTTPDPAPVESGRCGQTFRGIVLNGERPTACCDLLAGHPGWHRDRAHGMEWGATDSAELARVGPVDAAARRASVGHGYADAIRELFAAVDALDGDAAATPQPAAAESIEPGYEHLADLHAELTDVISDHYPSPDHVDAQTPAATLAAALLPVIHANVIGLVADEVNAWQVKIRAEDEARAAVSSAPPADVPARLAAAADALDAIGWAGLGYDLRDIAQQLTPGDPRSDGGVEAAVAAVARALATPTTAREG